jgi:hypothetical protein
MQPLLAPPRDSGFTNADVLAAFTLGERAVKVRHGVDVLSTTDQLTTDTVRLLDGEVIWSYRPPDEISSGQSATTDVAEVRRRATLTIEKTGVPVAARRFRPWTEFLGPDGRWVRSRLGVFIPANPSSRDDGLVVTDQLDLADKTFRYANRFLTDPLVVPASTGGVPTNCVAWVAADLASRFAETAVSIPTSSVTLAVARVFEPGTSWLAVYNALLEVAAYDQLTCNENGQPTSRPLASIAGMGSEYSYGAGAGKVIVAGDVAPLLATTPNRVRFVARQGPSLPTEGNGARTKTNQSSGPASIDQRGDIIETTVEVEAEGQTQLDTFANAESQRWFAGGGTRWTGKVGLNPLHSDRDVVTLVKPRQDLSGLWQVTEWRYPLRTIDGEDTVTMPITCEQRVVVS